MATVVGIQRSRVDEVCARLSKRILAQASQGETWLPPERELAEQLGVSRTVVREATKRLELQGLLEVRHGVGLKVVDRLHAPLTGALELLLPEESERLSQLAETRLVVEPMVARIAAERAGSEHLRALRNSQDRLGAAIETADAIDADLEFHRLLAQAAGNRILELLLESLGDLGRDSRRATLATTGIALAHQHHAEILNAVEKRHPDEAFHAMRRHMVTASHDLAHYFAARNKTNRNK